MTSFKTCTPSAQPTANASYSRASGFTLLELSIVIAVIGIITAAMVSMGDSMIEAARRGHTRNKLDTIETALMAYRLANERLPCPAQADLATTDTNYGVEANNTSGTCTGGTPAANASVVIPKGANSTNIAFNTTVAEGAVPFKQLNLPESFMYDGWGRKIAYAVWTPIAAESAFLSYGITPSCGAITVKDAGGSYRTQSSVYALVSFGPDGHGGYLKSGTRYNAKSINADEQTNAHYDQTGADKGYAATYVEKAWTEDSTNSHNDFSDFVRFKERWQMQDAYDRFSPTGLPCTPGFRIDGTIAAQKIGLDGMWTADLNGDGIPDLIIPGRNFHLYIIFGQPNSGSFPNTIRLPTDLNGSNGVDLDISSVWGSSGSVYIVKGDFNGDGIDDIAISTTRNTASAQYVSLLFGQKSGWTTSLNLSSLNTATSPMVAKIDYDNSMSGAGTNRIAVGDVNGVTNTIAGVTHNVDDVIIGALYQTGNGQTQAGNVYVVFGNTAPGSIATTASALNGSNGFEIEGYRTNNYTGIGISTGDFNGDKISDIAIQGGYSYIIWGHSASYVWPKLINLNPGSIDGYALAADGSQGFENNYGGGYGAYTAAGDITGDNNDDAFFVNPDGSCGGVNCGAVFVLFGNKTWPASNSYDVSTLNGTNGTILEGNWGNGDIGIARPPIGFADTTGTGKNTFFTATIGYSGSYHGFVAFYPQTTWTNPFATTSLNGSNGFRFTGLTGSGGSGALGDVNGDSISDYLMGDIGANSSAGAVYIVKGTSGTLPANITPATLAGYGYEIDGATTGDEVGTDLTTLDINHDGIPDFAICAPYASYSGAANSGSCYVIWGHKGSWISKLNLSVLN